MKVLLVSTYSPDRCGVAAYAAQTAAALKEAGHQVDVLTWGAGKGEFHLSDRPAGRRALSILPYCRGYDRLIVQYMPSFYVDERSRWSQIESRLALAKLFRRLRRAEIIVHEQPWYPDPKAMSVAGRMLWHLERYQWASAVDLCFHNQAAVEVYRTRFRLPGRNARVIEHGRDFRRNYAGGRAAARQELGLPLEVPILLSPGFVTRYKGYDQAIDALRACPEIDCQYHIVGSVHPDNRPDDLAYLSEIRSRAAGDARVHFCSEFVDDVAFDRWLCASDAVLLPYRSSTSSSVLARCHLIGTPAITSRAAGLEAELRDTDVAFDTVAELQRQLAAYLPRIRTASVQE